MCILCSQARKSQGIPYQGAKLDKKIEKSSYSPLFLYLLCNLLQYFLLHLAVQLLGCGMGLGVGFHRIERAVETLDTALTV